MGWKVITIWECQLKKDKQEKTLGELYEIFKDFYPINKYYQFLKIPISYMKNSFFDAKSFNICKK